ncbi:MAG: hypothetical protein U9N55_06765 [candidate division Zixibacteria bacterium]|nr:hypothetical protein [candidate division Zixibacteria bacterium]
MPLKTSNRLLFITLWFSIVLFVTAQAVGSYLFDNGWAFDHWQYIPLWYIIVWLLVSVGLGTLLVHNYARVANVLSSKKGAIGGAIVLFALLLIFQFDSFLYGGGNLRVAQIAQTDNVIFRWFEFGSTFVVWLLYHLISLFVSHTNTAGVIAWKSLAFLCSALSLIGTIKLVGVLSSDRLRRLCFFALIFFGPQFMLQFGFVGIEPIVVAITVWFAYSNVILYKGASLQRFLIMWGIFLLGVFMHATLVFLLPAALYVSLTAVSKRSNFVTLLLPLIIWSALLATIYVWAGQNLEMSRQLLFLSGKPPFSDYGLISPRRIWDIIQLILLVFPLVFFMKYLMLQSFRRTFSQPLTVTAMYMCLGGFTVVVVTDPTHSIALDLPHLAAYLSPAAFLLAVLWRDSLKENSNHVSTSLTAILTTAAIMLPLGYLPVYTTISCAEGHVESYMDMHEAYWIGGGPALRDSYFYRGEMDKANEWDRKHIVKSLDYMDYQGAIELAAGGKTADAIRSLNNVIARNPYWAESRALYATIQMGMNRFALAKPQIDTALMLEPYRKRHLVNLYRYYRDSRNLPQALIQAKKTAALFPSDLDIRTDLMIINYRNGLVATAETMAADLIAIDSTLAYPYLIKAFIFEKRGQLQRALTLYNRFIDLAPDEPDTPVIIEQRDNLQEKLQK